jgi:hypothetical protein
MSDITFYSKPFTIHGFHIPEIVVTKGKLVRIYVPNCLKYKVPKDLDISEVIADHFLQVDPFLMLVKHFDYHTFWERIKPLTVEHYLLQRMNLEPYKALQIAEEMDVDLKDRFSDIGATKRRTLTIKAHFQKFDCIVFDYYAIDALGIKFMEDMINTEIEKGKSAIAFDNLAYMEDSEPYANIQRVEIFAQLR